MAKDQNTSKSVAEEYKGEGNSTSKVPKNAFSLLFDEMLQTYTSPNNEEGEPELSRKEIGERLGISRKLFPKRINWEKPSTSRDTIIAMCMVLKADLPVINKALYLHEMPGLDPDYPRDYGIIQIVHNYGDKPLTLEDINERLELKKIDPLIIPHRGKKDAAKKRLPFRVKGKRFIPQDQYFLDYSVYGDQYNSLCTEYHPSRFHAAVDMWIENITTGDEFVLSAYADGYRYGSNKSNEIDYFITPVEDGYVVFHEKKTDGINGEYKVAYTELTDMVIENLRKYFSCVNDTRNYKDRVSARIIHEELHIFCESFNYSIPEMNEYYLTDYCKGKYITYRSDQSIFMKWYLNPAEYQKYYGEPPKIYKVELDKKGQKANDVRHTERWKRIIQRIQNKQVEMIDNLLNKLAKHEAYIQDLSSIYDTPYAEIEHYGLGTQFGYKEEIIEPDRLIISVDKESIVISVDSQDVEITTDDIKEGFMLGCEDIQEIARLKLKHKNLKKIIPNIQSGLI